MPQNPISLQEQKSSKKIEYETLQGSRVCVQARLGLTRTERLVAVGCYTQSNYNLPLAITFVKQRAPTSWLPSTDTELGEVLENWFLETPEATIVAFEYT